MNEADAPQSWFMLGATEVNLTSWTLRPSTPSALLITPLSPDIWLVESENAELKLDSTGDAGMSMEAWSNSPSDDAKHRFIIWRGDQEEARKVVEKHLASTPR